MKSLSDNYTATHSNTHETFADLVFCALVVLILFVLALTIEVSQRVRAELATVEPVEEISHDELVSMTPEELSELTLELKNQQSEIANLKSALQKNSLKVDQQLAAMAGEQRFTGARAPAALNIAYDYKKRLFYFVPSKDVEEADRRNSGEAAFEYIARKQRILVDVALQARKQRGFTLTEARNIYAAISRYQMVVPTLSSYRLEQEDLGLYYHVTLCEYIAGDTERSTVSEKLVVDAILRMHEKKGPRSDEMYPRCRVLVDEASRTVSLGGVKMHPSEFKNILLSVSGRGLMLDLEGFTGKAPSWFYEKVLAPAGYISKTPRLPGR